MISPDVELLAAWSLVGVVGVHPGRTLYDPEAVTDPCPGLVAAMRRAATQRAMAIGPSETAGALVLEPLDMDEVVGTGRAGHDPGQPTGGAEWTRHGDYRAQAAAGLAHRVADRWGVAVWARWRPAGGWLLGWAPGPDCTPGAEEVLAALGQEELAVGTGGHRQRVGLLFRSGQAAHWAARILRPGMSAILRPARARTLRWPAAARRRLPCTR